ncbi:NAD(P)/FAD-dependent oxidoreductase [Alkaliphilus serpentinus]|uniref:FAD-dependent protein C-terminal domain-containing protein n=1 Tax=Alkaliphilus serpentinus TaxID=1482731 RepID=A0A833HPD5_9FIRM|nr:hypothetical protein [Alkaliphilus serpentinus]KAB3530551.1 hypothetical protein F8153_06800 [Alkaliphilus serpentinus]
MLRISEIKYPIETPENQIRNEIIKRLKIKDADLIEYTIYKKSLDARKKDQIYFVYIVDAKVHNEAELLKRVKGPQITITPDLEYKPVAAGERDLEERPIVVGTGPAGLFAALVLAEGGYKPLLLERGKSVEERTKDVEEFWNTGILKEESNVQFGEGGAGTFSDGKLTTQIKDLRCRKVLKEMIVAGAPEEIIYHYKPHVGTDLLRGVVKNIRERIIALGGEMRFNSKATDLIIKDDVIKGVIVNGGEEISSEAVILAIGHSARDTFHTLYNHSVEIHQKPFSIGVRIEHPQGAIDRNQYGKYAGHEKLGAADYKLSHHCSNGRGAYTFCMCPGGEVVAATSEVGRLVTNGMSYHARDAENANSALLVGVGPEDFESEHPLAGVFYQQKWEEAAFKLGGSNYHAPCQLVGDFLKDKTSKEVAGVKPSYKPGVTMTDLRQCLPPYVTEAMKEAIIALNNKIRGFSNPEAVLTGVETRSSSPIRILRNDEMESNIKGLYPAGEGAGYAGGIVSAAVDGIKVAEAIIRKYAPLK